jgi:hypothetical protein
MREEDDMPVDGQWKIIIQTPMGPREAELEILVQGATFSGTAKGAVGESALEGQVNGDQLTWTSKITTPMPMTLAFDVVFSGDQAHGAVKLGMLGKADVTGSRL